MYVERERERERIIDSSYVDLKYVNKARIGMSAGRFTYASSRAHTWT